MATSRRIYVTALALMLMTAGCQRSSDAQLALGDAVSRGDLDEAERILKKGVDIDYSYPEADGYTLLMIASSTPDGSGLVTFLLERGADPNVSAPSGRTALQVAAMNGRVGHARNLVEAGASLLATDREGKTAADFAEERGHDEVIQVLIEADENDDNAG